MLDIDNTLVARDRTEATAEYKSWVASLSTHGFSVCFVSNNWHDVVFSHAEALGFDVVAKAMKPFPLAFWAAMRRVGVRARECAVVGDQLFTDVFGGNLVGARTILVQPLSQTDLTHTLVLRRLERVIMHGRRPSA